MHKRKFHGAQRPEADEIDRRSRPSRALNRAFEIMLFLLAGLVVLAAAGPLAGLWHYEVIESGSMTPALRVGGVAVVVPEPLSNVHVGQVLAFHPPKMGNYVRIHRVIALTQRGNQVWVTTKGDANPVADPGPIQLKGTTAYTERAFVPYVGYAGVWLYKHSTRALLEGTLLVLMVAGGLWLIWGGKRDEDEKAAEATVPVSARPATARAAINKPATARPTTAQLATARPAPALPVAARSRWSLRSAKTGPVSDAHIVAEKAATATLVALNNLYTADPEGGEPTAASRPASSKHASTGQ